MAGYRVIPCLLLQQGGLYKTRQFRNPSYVGDPINAVRILNEKEVDELVFLDIDPVRHVRGPDFELIKDITSEAFMPFAYGGGIRTIDQVKRLIELGVEKVVLNSSALEKPELVTEIAATVGASSLVVSLDVRRSLLGQYSVWMRSAEVNTRNNPVDLAVQMERLGAGELLVTSIDRDGMMNGYDLKLVEQVASKVKIPVVANGGAGSVHDLGEGLRAGASAVAAGSLFVYHGKHRAVLINYPNRQVIDTLLEGIQA